MNEKTKLFWLLDAIHATLISRMHATPGLVGAVEEVINLAARELDPNHEVNPPNIQYLVGDFKLPKELLERIPR